MRSLLFYPRKITHSSIFLTNLSGQGTSLTHTHREMFTFAPAEQAKESQPPLTCATDQYKIKISFNCYNCVALEKCRRGHLQVNQSLIFTVTLPSIFFSWNNTDCNTLTKQIITYDKFTSVDLKNHRYPSGNFPSFAGKSHEQSISSMYFHNEFYFHGRIWVLLLFFFFLIRVGVIILKCLKSHFGVKLYKRRDGCRGAEPAKLSTRAQIDSYVSVHDANQQGDEIMKPRMTGTCQTANS